MLPNLNPMLQRGGFSRIFPERTPTDNDSDRLAPVPKHRRKFSQYYKGRPTIFLVRGSRAFGGTQPGLPLNDACAKELMLQIKGARTQSPGCRIPRNPHRYRQAGSRPAYGFQSMWSLSRRVSPSETHLHPRRL